MRRFSKIAAVVVVGALALSGCGSSSGGSGGSESSASEDVCKSAKGDGPKVGVAYDVGGRGDQSFNDSAYRGLTKAIEDLGATCIEAKATTSTTTTPPARSASARSPRVATTRSSRSATSTPRRPPRSRRRCPDTNFAVVDGYSTTLPKPPLKNLNDLVFAANEGSYLVGVAAALKTKAKHVGFVGGVPGDRDRVRSRPATRPV